MASDIHVVQSVIENIPLKLTYKKSPSGDQYMVLYNNKPVFFIWDNEIHVQIREFLDDLFCNERRSHILIGECYTVDGGNYAEKLTEAINLIDKMTEAPTKKYEIENLQEVQYIPLYTQAFYHALKVDRDGVTLGESNTIPFSQIKKVIHQKILSEAPGLGGWVKIVTDDNPAIPELIGGNHKIQGSTKDRVGPDDNCMIYCALAEKDCLANRFRVEDICHEIKMILTVNKNKFST